MIEPALIAAPWLIVLILLWALVVGQPAAVQADRERIATQSTEIANYRATIVAYPSPTAVRRYFP